MERINIFIYWQEWDNINGGIKKIGNNIFSTNKKGILSPDDLIYFEKRIQMKHSLESQPFISNFIILK